MSSPGQMDTSELLGTLVPATLTCLACVGLFGKYIKMKNQSVGFSVVIILCISDFIFSTAIILRKLRLSIVEDMIFLNIFHTAMFFSIFWASTVSYLVYSSLTDENFASKQIIVKTALVVLPLALLANLILFWIADFQDLYKILCPILTASNIFTIIYYIKSMSILKTQIEYFARSTKVYIRGLRCYVGAQLITSVPLIVYLTIKKFNKLDFEEKFPISQFLEEFIAFSGFINAINFAVQGPGKESKSELREDDELYLSFNDPPPANQTLL